MKLPTQTILSLLLAGSALIGCATTHPPQELVDARSAYQQAQKSHASELSPVSLHAAKQALDSAEKKFEDDGASVETRDQAYIALRKAQLAQTDGSIAHRNRELEAARRGAADAQAKAAQQTQTDLVQTRQQLTQETSAREEAERRAQEAMEKLKAANAAVKQEPRGTVITLPGNVLFGSGKSMLLPSAQASLNDVADALKDQKDATMLIEGHTDSTGSDDTNLQLSKARADAVASYLTSRGLPQDRITTQGLGSSRPVASNDSTEGRATNRRVEIIVKTQPSR